MHCSALQIISFLWISINLFILMLTFNGHLPPPLLKCWWTHVVHTQCWPFKILFLEFSPPTHGKRGMQRCKPKITFTESGPKVETQDWAERPAMCSCSSQFRQSAINGKSAFNGMQSCNQTSGKMHFHCNHRLRSMPLRSMGDATQQPPEKNQWEYQQCG